MAPKNKATADGGTASHENAATGELVQLALLYVLSANAKMSLAVSAAITSHALAANQVLAKCLRGAMINASRPKFTDDFHAVVEFNVCDVSGIQGDLDRNKLSESICQVVDLIEHTTICVAVGCAAAQMVEEGVVNSVQMLLARGPQDAPAILDDKYNVVVSKSPLPHVRRLKPLLAAAGRLTALGVEAQYKIGGKSMTSPAIPPEATKAHRHADSTHSDVYAFTGYLTHHRIAEVTVQEKSVQLEVPADYSTMIEQAVKADAMVRMTVDVYKSNNPCLPDEPHLKIVSIDDVVGQAKLKLVG